MQQPHATSQQSGVSYFFKGFELIRQKGLKRFVFIPLTVNLVLFSIAFYYLFGQLDVYMAKLDAFIPDFLSWLSYLLWPLAVAFMLVFFSFIFSSVANWLAAPFNGLLSEKVEEKLTGQVSTDGSFTDIVKDTPRTLSREWCKFRYYLPRAIGFLLLSWLIPIIGQIIWFLFVAWMMAVQYKDYPFDNHKINFDLMKDQLRDKKSLSFSFGITVAVFAMVPIVNLIVMPVAICGATALWVDHYRAQNLGG